MKKDDGQVHAPAFESELADLRTRLAARDAELSHWRQQYLLVESLWTSVQRSRSWKLLAPLRFVRQLLAPRGCGARDLIPWQQLEPVRTAAPRTWRSTGGDPHFFVPCLFRAGWVRVRLRMTSTVWGKVEFFSDSGGGFSGAECFERVDCRGGLDLDFCVHFPRPVRGIRFDPLDREGEFRLDQWRVDPLPLWQWVHSGWHAFAALCAAAWRRCQSGPRKHGTQSQLFLPGLRGASYRNTGGSDIAATYQAWLRRQQLTDVGRARLRAEATATAPRISILMPVRGESPADVRRSVASVVRQISARWQLCVAVGADAARALRRELADHAGKDPRIHIVSLGGKASPAQALNAALNAAGGDYFALLEPGDELAEQALCRAGQLLEEDAGIDFLYSDEDQLDPGGGHVDPFFKPDWSPEYLLACMYTGRLGVYRTALVRAAGGFRPEFAAAAEYDLVLRLLARCANVRHVPEMLYHGRQRPEAASSTMRATPAAAEAARRAVHDYLRSTGRGGSVEAGLIPGVNRVRYATAERPLVSIIIPCAGWPAKLPGTATYALARCVDSIGRQTADDHYEIIVVSNADMPADLTEFLEDRGVQRIGYEPPYCWSRAANWGASRAGGDLLLFLHDDVEVAEPEWIEALREFALQPDIGAVGGKLLFPDGRLQHAGVTLLDGAPAYPFQLSPGDDPGYYAGNLVHRNASAVSGACLMTRADVFRSVAGFTEALDARYGDVDYCLKVLAAGRRVVYTPYARLYHDEAVGKLGIHAQELQTFKERWAARRTTDPYYNPNLSQLYCYRL